MQPPNTGKSCRSPHKSHRVKARVSAKSFGSSWQDYCRGPKNCTILTLSSLVLSAGLVSPVMALAQAENASENQRQIQQLQLLVIEIQRESQLKLEALQRQSEQQMQQLQAKIAQLRDDIQSQGSGHESPPAMALQSAPQALGSPDKLKIHGDFRLRYEYNSASATSPSWDRGVLRGRLATRYRLNDNLDLGARLVTGDPDNPRTSDITIGDWDSNLDISLDQAYAAFSDQDLFLTGGKFAKPFISTELVWDGDVNIQGLGGYYDFFNHKHWSARFVGIYFLISQDIYEKGSDMLGGQFSLELHPHPDWDLELHSAYYDYDIGARNLDIPGGARGNSVTPDRRFYISDFNLLDIMGSLDYRGFGEPWNIRLVADYVKNLGAKVPEDTGYEVDLYVGDLSQTGSFLFRYGYSQAETDAVLGMFSNDNIIYPTNYELHTLSVDYALQPHIFLGLTNYFYRRLNPDLKVSTDGWLFRTRLNLYFTF